MRALKPSQAGLHGSMCKNMLWSQANASSRFLSGCCWASRCPVPHLPKCSDRISSGHSHKQTLGRVHHAQQGPKNIVLPSTSPQQENGEKCQTPSVQCPAHTSGTTPSLIPENSLPLSTPGLGSTRSSASYRPCNLGQVPSSSGLSLPFCKTGEG